MADTVDDVAAVDVVVLRALACGFEHFFAETSIIE